MEEKLMPDFDTRKPPEPNEPNRLRIPLIANRLRVLLITTKLRIQSIANGLRSLLLANKVRISLVGGVILLLVGAAFTVLLPIYSSSGKGNWQPGVLDGAPHSQIVFGPGDSGLWAMNADGSNQSRLLESAASAPAWSPDGTKIAFTRIVEESADASATPESIPSIVIMNADGSDQRELLDEPASDPAWSPDGKKIAFSKSTPNGLSFIYIMNADGSGEPRRLTKEDFARDADPAWSPDGTEIAFQSTRPNTPEPLPLPPNQTGSQLSNTEIYVIDACCEESDTNKPQPLTGSIGYNADPAWSPDGTEIAFTYMSFRLTCPYGCETVVRTTDVYKMDADGCGKRRLTPADPDNEHPEQGPAWSPDGKLIAYVRGSTASSSIYKIDSDGSDPTFVGKFPTASSAGSKLDWMGTTAGRGGNVEQEAGDQGANAGCTGEAGDEKQGIVAPPEDVTPEAYMDQIDELLREHDLRGSQAGSEARRQARTQTLKVLEASDPTGRARVLRFLTGAGLVQGVGAEKPIISLGQVDLENAGLREVHLGGAALGGADLDGVDMRGADLSEAYAWEIQLRKSDLRGADLAGSNLTGAELKDADLRDADLTNANLFSADLTGADLTGAVLTGTDLREAVMSGTEVTLPDEHTAKVPAWEAAARASLKDVLADLTTCMATTHGDKVLLCTDSDSAFRYAQDDLRPNVAWRMVPQTKQVGSVRKNTGEVLVQVAHNYGGSAFQSSTAATGRIERIPRWF
jgi:Tol biopolymer transport system component/uncharacterized protein YjbI with pentapeptide repeats